MDKKPTITREQLENLKVGDVLQIFRDRAFSGPVEGVITDLAVGPENTGDKPFFRHFDFHVQTGLDANGYRSRLGCSEWVTVREGDEAEVVTGLEAAWARIFPKAYDYMDELKRGLETAGEFFIEGPNDTTGDEYSLELVISKGGDEPAMYATLTVKESEEFGDEPGGINFAFELHSMNIPGRAISSVMPNNYGPDCWVEAADPEQVQDRFELITELVTRQDFIRVVTENWGEKEDAHA